MIAQLRAESKRFAQKGSKKFVLSAEGGPVGLQQRGAQDGGLRRGRPKPLFEEGGQQRGVQVQLLGGGQADVKTDAVPFRPAVQGGDVCFQVQLFGALFALCRHRGGVQGVVARQAAGGRRRVADGIAGKSDGAGLV